MGKKGGVLQSSDTSLISALNFPTFQCRKSYLPSLEIVCLVRDNIILKWILDPVATSEPRGSPLDFVSAFCLVESELGSR